MTPYLDAVAISKDESVVAVAAMRYCDDRGRIIAFSLSDGRELWRRETSSISSATGLAVIAAPASIPLLSNVALLVLAVLLASSACFVIRR